MIHCRRRHLMEGIGHCKFQWQFKLSGIQRSDIYRSWFLTWKLILPSASSTITLKKIWRSYCLILNDYQDGIHQKFELEVNKNLVQWNLALQPPVDAANSLSPPLKSGLRANLCTMYCFKYLLKSISSNNNRRKRMLNVVWNTSK